MEIPTSVHAALATVLLCLCLVRLVLSQRAVQENSLHQKLDLALSLPMIALQAVLVGLSWGRPIGTEMEVIVGFTSLFPSLLGVSPITLFP